MDTTAPRIPTEFHYWKNLNTQKFRSGVKAFRRLFGFSPDLPEAVVKTFAESYYLADPVAEAFVDEVYLGGDPKKGRAMLDQALEHGIDSVPDAPPSMRALFAEREQPPAWLDKRLVAQGARVFRHFGPGLFQFFGAITLDAYGNSSVVKPLVLTGAYAGESAKARFMETCAFWVDVSEPGGLEPGGEGWKTTLRVRIMHVFVRRRLISHPEWRMDDWGVPISQADAMITLMAGSVAPGYLLRIAGYRTSEQEILALMHFWRYVGHLMGVQPPWYPQTVREGLQFSFMAFLSGAGMAGPDGMKLCKSFYDAFEPRLPDDAPWRERAWSWFEHKMHQGYVGFFVSSHTRKTAGIPSGGLWRLAPLAGAPLMFAMETVRRHVPRADDWWDEMSRRRRRDWLARHMGERKAEYTAVASFTR